MKNKELSNIFTHVHGIGAERKLKPNGYYASQKCRLSFRLLPRINSKDMTAEISKEEFKKVRYAVCFRQHFACEDGETEYFFTDFYDDDYEPKFLHKLYDLLCDIRFCLSLQGLDSESAFQAYSYSSPDGSYSIKFDPIYEKPKDRYEWVSKYKVCVSSSNWKIKQKRDRVQKSFEFEVNAMELRSGLLQFFKVNDYVPNPFTFRTGLDYQYQKLRCYKQSRRHKEKPLLLVDVNNLFRYKQHFDENNAFDS